MTRVASQTVPSCFLVTSRDRADVGRDSRRGMSGNERLRSSESVLTSPAGSAFLQGNKKDGGSLEERGRGGGRYGDVNAQKNGNQS